MVSPTTSEVQPTMGVKIFSAGMAACLADIITFPLDTAKVRLQVEFRELGEGSPGRGSAVGIPVMCAVIAQSGSVLGPGAVGKEMGLLSWIC